MHGEIKKGACTLAQMLLDEPGDFARTVRKCVYAAGLFPADSLTALVVCRVQ